MTLVDHVPAKYQVLFSSNSAKGQGPFRKGDRHRIFFLFIIFMGLPHIPISS
jgi:hypothetical protein